MKITPRDHVKFEPDRMAKIGLAGTARVQLDLYCLKPGQAQKLHAHDDQDKIYVVLEGRARVRLGDAEHALGAGEAVLAPAGTPHGLENDGETPVVALVVVTPPPRHAR
ncbi:MAG: cupin domain-containing protein [Candidatus Rokubacteria bacterium]|nr:cupin domain-containing protein [Candidatus Rokubacteria bacterium]